MSIYCRTYVTAKSGSTIRSIFLTSFRCLALSLNNSSRYSLLKLCSRRNFYVSSRSMVSPSAIDVAFVVGSITLSRLGFAFSCDNLGSAIVVWSGSVCDARRLTIRFYQKDKATTEKGENEGSPRYLCAHFVPQQPSASKVPDVSSAAHAVIPDTNAGIP